MFHLAFLKISLSLLHGSLIFLISTSLFHFSLELCIDPFLVIVELFLASLLFHTEALHKISTRLSFFLIQRIHFVNRFDKASWNFDRLLQLLSVNLLPFRRQRHVLTTANGRLQAYLLSFFFKGDLAFKDGFRLIDFVFNSCAFLCLNLTRWPSRY